MVGAPLAHRRRRQAKHVFRTAQNQAPIRAFAQWRAGKGGKGQVRTAWLQRCHGVQIPSSGFDRRSAGSAQPNLAAIAHAHSIDGINARIVTFGFCSQQALTILPPTGRASTVTETPPSAALTETATSRFATTSRWRLHYNEAGSGHPVILLHGTGPGATGWSNFHQNMAPLARHFRVIALDFPGWGKSDVFDCTGESRSGVNAEAIRQLMDKLGLEQAALVGNSMGGAAVLEFMAAYPNRISHAVTMGSGLFALPGMVSPSGLSQGIKVIVETYRDPSPANFRRLVEVMVYDASFASDELARQRADAAVAVRDHLDNWLKWPMGHPGGPFGGIEATLARLAVATTPTMMIHGRDDRTVPLEVTLKTAGLIPNACAVILNKCGHWAQVEHAARFNRLVTDFLRSTEH
jgi:2-hydroxy-6-oxonona-2,4-dienedioate hydrolase